MHCFCQVVLITLEIRKLNSMRGIAAFIVLLTHFSDATGWLEGRLGGRAGQYGVMLFFLLSGFLMAYLYLDLPFTKTAVKRYALARAGRVLPLFLLVVLISFFGPYIGTSSFYELSDWPYFLSHLLFLEGESVLWSVAPEIHFYAIFIGLWFLASWRPGYLYLLIAASMVLLFLLNFPRPHGTFLGIPYDFHLFRSLPYFFVGLLMGKHYKSFHIPEYMKSHWYVLALLLIPLLYPDFTPVKSSANFKMWLHYEVLFVMATVFFCVTFLVPDDNKLLANKAGDFIGKVSYSLYLLHMPVLYYVNKLELQIELKLFTFVAVSLLVACVSFHFIEKPLARIIKR